MSFFNSLRRRSAQEEEGKYDSVKETPVASRRRVGTFWSLTPKKRRSIPWDLQMSKSEDDSKLIGNAIEDTVYPRYDPQNPDHSSSSTEPKDSGCCQQPEAKPRGRSLSWTKSSPFSALRKRSWSGSRSSSPTRNILHRAAELVKAPTALFYRDRPDEEPLKTSIESTSPVKSLQSKKSVHFVGLDDEDSVESIVKSSPIPIPGKSAPSLPPVEVSTSELMNIGNGSTAALTGRPPPTPIMAALLKTPKGPSPCHDALGAPALENSTFPVDIPAQEQAQRQLENPFDDRAEICDIKNSLDQRVAGTRDATNQSDEDLQASQDLAALLGVERDTGLFRAICGSNNVEQAPTDPFRTPTTPRSGTVITESDTSPVAKPKEGEDSIQNSSLATVDTTKLSQTSLPLRLKRSADPVASPSLMEKAVEVGKKSLLSERLNDTASNLDITPAHKDPAVLEIDSLRASITQRGMTQNAERRQSHSHGDVHDCAHMLERMCIEDRSANGRTDREKQAMVDCDKNHNAGGTPPQRNESRSPTRRRFRFENRADTSSGDQAAVPPNTPRSQMMIKVPNGQDEQNIELQTPSPSEVPLPPSIHPSKKNILLCQAHTFRDQHGWSPFIDERFVEASINKVLGENGDKDFIQMISQQGGFLKFWKETSLSPSTAPLPDSIAPSLQEANNLTDAIIGWAHHTWSRNEATAPSAAKGGCEPSIKYFKQRNNSPATGGFFAPITSFNHNRSSEALSEATHDLYLDSGDCTSAETFRSNSDRSVHSICTEEKCFCSPCGCDPCYCGLTEEQMGKVEHKSASTPTPGCTCNPCTCDPCRCDNENSIKEGQGNESPRPYAMLTPIDERYATVQHPYSRTDSTHSEPNQPVKRKYPQIGSVPLRYFNRDSVGSRTTLASDTSLDEEEAYCAGIV